MTIEVHDVPAASHYEVTVGGQHAGLAAYRRKGDVVVFTHTEIDAPFEGQGVGSALARAALDDVRARGWQVEPKCVFIRDWIDKHPDYRDVVSGGS